MAVRAARQAKRRISPTAAPDARASLLPTHDQLGADVASECTDRDELDQAKHALDGDRLAVAAGERDRRALDVVPGRAVARGLELDGARGRGRGGDAEMTCGEDLDGAEHGGAGTRAADGAAGGLEQGLAGGEVGDEQPGEPRAREVAVALDLDAEADQVLPSMLPWATNEMTGSLDRPRTETKCWTLRAPQKRVQVSWGSQWRAAPPSASLSNRVSRAATMGREALHEHDMEDSLGRASGGRERAVDR